MQNIIKIIRLSRPLYHLVAILSILILASSVLGLIAPIFSKFIVDEIVRNVQGHGGDSTRLILLIVVAFVSNLLSLVISTLSDRVGDHFSGRIRKFLTEKFYDKVLTLPQSYFDSEMSGRIVNQLSRGILTIQGFLNSTTNFILPTFLQSIFTVAVLAYYNVPIAVLTFILFPIYLILSYYSTVKWGKEEVKKNAIEDRLRGRIQEVISNITLVKSFTNEKEEYDFVSNGLDNSNKIYATQSTTFHKFDFFRGLSLNIILFGINILVFYNTFQRRLTIGEMVLILQLVNQARIPLFAMSFILTQIQTAEAGSKEFFGILSLPAGEDYGQVGKSKIFKEPTLEFRHVSFSYNEDSPVLKDVSFKLQKNKVVALVGHSGAGKSTIVNLILKLYQPTTGEIVINGKSYSDYDSRVIRQNISLVFQDNELFSSTIKENVAYGKKNASEKEIVNALKLANAYGFVSSLPKGIESEVGERGVRLSGGQKQRIQIARAILKNSPILILDEATSSLDAKSEREVQEALEKLMQDKLVIIIAHRFSTIRNVDTIVVVDLGVIADSGSPKELANRKGLYQELLHYQVEGNKKLLEKYGIY